MFELDARQRAILADALGDTSETVMSVHRLRRGLGRALVLGPPERPAAVVIQAHTLPAEPTGFGDDPDQLLTLLRDLEGWSCVNVSLGIGVALAAAIERDLGRPCRLEEEVYSVLEPPVKTWTDPTVHRLTLAEVPLMEATTDGLDMTDWRFGSAARLLAEGFAAGAVIDQRLVAIAFTSARGDRHAEIGVATLAPWRGRGLATAAAALVCAEVQMAGQTPVWSTSGHNAASRRIAAKLGFVEVGRRVYVNLV